MRLELAHSRIVAAALMFAAPAIACTALAETAEEKGLRIARDADDRINGFQDYTSTLSMTLKTKAGQQAVRELRVKVLEVQNDGDKSLTIFDQPRDVEGTALLTFAHKVADDDIWLFLPALKRVKRIAGSNKSGPFMGSEFAFEDISSQEVEKYTYKYLREDTHDGQACHVVNAVPVDRNSGYSRQEVWLDKAELRAVKVDYFNRRGDHLKTMVASDFKKYLDRFWYPDRMLMTNHQSGRSTVLEYKNYRFRNGFTEREFDQASLEGAR
ncbi:MAG: outer membrane lipoprotein-sorting protein [Steroidobacteraceae bacterium]